MEKKWKDAEGNFKALSNEEAAELSAADLGAYHAEKA